MLLPREKMQELRQTKATICGFMEKLRPVFCVVDSQQVSEVCAATLRQLRRVELKFDQRKRNGRKKAMIDAAMLRKATCRLLQALQATGYRPRPGHVII